MDPKQPQSQTQAKPADTKTAEEEQLRQKENKVEEILRRRQEAFLEEEKVLLEWEAPQRVFKKRPKEYFTTIGAIVILVCLILLFVQEFLLIAVIVAICFVAYTLATVEPEKTKHEISTRGVRTGGKFYRWDELGRYWFDDHSGQTVLNIETFITFPRLLILIVSDKDKIKDLLSPYLLLEKPEPGFLDKTSEWLAKKVPLEGS